MEKIETPYEIGKKYKVRFKYFGELVEATATYKSVGGANTFHFESGGYLGPEQIDSAELLPEPKEQEPNKEADCLQDLIRKAVSWVELIGETDLAASLKSKHPEIWPVDHKEAVLKEAIALVEDHRRINTDHFSGSWKPFVTAVRNYIESKNERK